MVHSPLQNQTPLCQDENGARSVLCDSLFVTFVFIEIPALSDIYLTVISHHLHLTVN